MLGDLRHLVRPIVGTVSIDPVGGDPGGNPPKILDQRQAQQGQALAVAAQQDLAFPAQAQRHQFQIGLAQGGQLAHVERPAIHPLFVVVSGGVEEWEVVP